MARLLLSLALLPLAATPALGGAGPPIPPTPLRVAVADAVLVGKVTDVADNIVKPEMDRGDTREMRVATVRAQTSILGRPGTTARVGVITYRNQGRFPVPQLVRGQEVLLFLKKHPTKEGLFVLVDYYNVIPKKGNTGFAKEVEIAKKAAQVLASPQTALRAKTADDRLFAAAVLVTRNKTAPGAGAKTEAVPAAESKLILTALADADWANAPGRDWQMSPQGLFFRLGATQKDGWVQPKDFQQIASAAKKWLKDNAATFKMTRFARDKATDDPEP